MPVIKRYPNRKLYDTEARAYISLAQAAQLIRDGAEVQVIDHATGEDLTVLTLAQIIVEQAKEGGDLLPRAVLAALVRAGGDALAALRRGLAAPRELARQVDEEIAQRIEGLVQAGDLTPEEGLRLRERLSAPAGGPVPSARAGAPAAVRRAVARRGIPSRAEIAALTAQLDALAAEVAALAAARRPAEPRPPQ